MRVHVPCPKCKAEQPVDMRGGRRPTQYMSEDSRLFFNMVCLNPQCHHQFKVEDRDDGRIVYVP